MTRLASLALSVVLAGATVAAHGTNDHVRGVVTEISAQAITVQTGPKVTKTLTLTDKTTYKQNGKAAHLENLKVGDRVVVDVPQKTTQALLIQIGAAPAAAPAAAHK